MWYSRNTYPPGTPTRMLCPLFGLVSLCITIWGAQTPIFAQTPSPVPPAPSDAARALAGPWEISNPDRDRRCTLTFKLDPAPQGRVVTLGPTCAAAFPDLRPTAAWTIGSDDALRLVDAKGVVLF